MATPNQKAEDRPISFVLHNMAWGDARPVEVKLVIRPEDLSRSETSRLNVVQTLGGAWADNFGPGVPTVQISGHTGWGAGGRANGLEAFKNLHDTIFSQWHSLRAFALESGRDPDLVKLIFADYLDDFVWVVAPQNFLLRRNKSRPLLSQYQINMTWLSDDVSETMKALKDKSQAEKESLGLESLSSCLDGIMDFANKMAGEINAFFGPIKAAVGKLVAVTAAVLKAVKTVIKAGMTIVGAVLGNLFQIGRMLTQAASNLFAAVAAVQSVPGRIKAALIRVKAQFTNAYCILSNVFKRRVFLPNYDGVYGASLCSSTAGGRPLSRYLNTNTFESVIPVEKSRLAVSSDGLSALTTLCNADVVKNPPSMASLGGLATRISNGVLVV